MNQATLYNDIINAFGSFDQPDWSFVEKRYARNPYGILIIGMSHIAQVEETTDVNDDWSVVLSLTIDGEGLCVRLSLVGKYACVSDSEGVFLSAEDLTNQRSGSKVCRLLKEKHVELLEVDTLRMKIKFGNEQLTLYEILFSSDEGIEYQSRR